MDTRFWGPCGWVLLHGIVNNYSENNNSNKKEEYKLFFNSLPYVLPCIYCRRSLTQYYQELPLTDEILNNKGTLCKWIYDIHNKVNEKLRSQGLNNKKDPSFSSVCKKISKKDYCKINKCWNFLYSIAMNYPEEKKNISLSVKTQYYHFFYYFMLLFPNNNLSFKMLEYHRQQGLLKNLENREVLLKWLYGIEKILSNDCICYEKRIEKTSKYIAGCNGKNDKKPTCRIKD